MHTVVCYGDSNTHGADPITHGRFPRDVRWPGVLASELGDGVHVIEEGLNGRTTLWDDPFMDFRNGKPYLLPCLRSHQPVDVLVLMLGTNDLKTIFGRAPHEIAAGAGALVDLALTSADRTRRRRRRPCSSSPRPASARRPTGPSCGASARRARRPRPCRGCTGTSPRSRASRSSMRPSSSSATPGDGVHLGAADHGVLGRAVAGAVREILAGR